jgi:membrane protein
MATFWKLLKEGFIAFYDDNALSRGAAIAFYLITALAPIIFITVMIARLGFGSEAVQSAVGYQLRSMMSPDNARLLQKALHDANTLSGGFWGSTLGIVTLIITASGVFTEIEDALNAIWQAPQKGSLVRRLLRGRLRSIGLVLGMGFLFLLSMIMTAATSALAGYIGRQTAFSDFFLFFLNFTISISVIAALVAAIYKILPNKKLEWRDVVVGAIGTALLFHIGQAAMGFYLGGARLEAPYGAAGGLIALMIWAYYSAQVFLLGAEFTKVWANHYGSQQAAPVPLHAQQLRAA